MNFEHAKSLPGPTVQLLTPVTGMNSIQEAAEESFPEGVTEHSAWRFPYGWNPAEGQGGGTGMAPTLVCWEEVAL